MKSLKALLAKPFAHHIRKKVSKWANNPVQTQEKVFKKLLKEAAHTEFGKDHDFGNIQSHDDFVKRVPIRDYEALRSYVDRVVAGEKDILWKGKPVYFAKTSGTTSGAKYIPITKESMPTHVEAARNAILLYMKGSPKLPSCGFSAQSAQAMMSIGEKFAYVDILQNPDIRAELPKYADWPTFPQLWINGELIGGCDIILEMYQQGELQELVKQAAQADSENA